MVILRLHPPLRSTFSSVSKAVVGGSQPACLNEAFAQLSIRSATPKAVFVRHASHAAQGAANARSKDGPGKRLGAKKSGEQYVIPGNIIFRQRGTHWFPGTNCAMGRDHTIYATEHGYVKYYKDPFQSKTRQFIGVAFDREDKLPYPRNAIRKRRLNMSAEKIEEPAAEEHSGEQLLLAASTAPGLSIKQRPTKDWTGNYERNLQLRPGGMYREGNWEIGRAAERANITSPAFKPRDRWAAWRKRTLRKEKGAEKRLGRKLNKVKKK